MRNTWSIFVSAILLAASVILLRTPGAGAATGSLGNDEQMFRSISIGAPLSSLSQRGFDVAKAERVPNATLIKRYKPKNSARFNSLDPAVRRCYQGNQTCTALIFDSLASRVIFLVQDGRVTWKEIIHPYVV